MMKRRLLLVLLMIPIALQGFGEETPIRVLIVTGNDYPGHKWKETTPVIREALERSGRFDVYVSEDPEIMATGIEQRYDALVLHYCNWESPMPSLECREGLARFVRSGKGLVSLHFACGAFAEWPEFVKIIGRVWDRENGHDPYGPFTVEVKDPNHPITRGMKNFETNDELYFCLTGDPSVDLLLTAHSKRTDKDEPMGFVLRYGKGNVFQTPLGHDVQAFSAPGVVTLLQRACEWAATGDVMDEAGSTGSR